MSAHQSPPYHPTLVNLRTAPFEDIDGALRHWRGWRVEFDTHTPDPTPADAELPGMWEQADFIDTSEAPPPNTRIPADAITPIPTPTPTQRPPAPTESNEIDFPGMALPSNADKRLTEAIRLIDRASHTDDTDASIGYALRALSQVISTIALPRCCEGGPQWGHAWTCDTLP